VKAITFRNYRIYFLHILFWIGVWFLFYYFFSYNSDDRPYVTWFSSLLVPLTMAITYFAIYFLIPRYLLQKKYGRFALFTFYMLLISAYAIVLIIYGCLIFLKKFDATNIPPMIKNFFFILILVYLIVGLLSFVSIINHNFNTDKQNKALQNKILSAQLQMKEQELHYLKKQIHPHFLFNTLNTIYGFALKQSKETPEIILKLSNLLDYILYQINKPRVPLIDELHHIKEYVDLEKIRFRETLKVQVRVCEINPELMIAPMLLIPFVENAFKHGSIINDYLTINISLDLSGDQLIFIIENTHKEEKDTIVKGGLGLENIRKRLDLHYEENYELNTRIKQQMYSVTLRIFDLKLLKDER